MNIDVLIDYCILRFLEEGLFCFVLLEREKRSNRDINRRLEHSPSLFQEHFLRTFPNEGPGSVILNLIRKQSPKGGVCSGEVLQEMQTWAGEHEASFYEFHKGLAHPPLLPAPCVSLSL